MQNVTTQFATAEYPIISVAHDPAPANGPTVSAACLHRVSFIGRRARPDGLALARVEGTSLRGEPITAYPLTAGFHVELFAERTRCGASIIVGLRVMRGRSDREQCKVRFVCGASYADATIDVE